MNEEKKCDSGTATAATFKSRYDPACISIECASISIIGMIL